MLKAATLILLLLFTRPSVRAQEGLPLSRTFIGQERFHQLINRAEAENWSGLPIGERVARFALFSNGLVAVTVLFVTVFVVVAVSSPWRFRRLGRFLRRSGFVGAVRRRDGFVVVTVCSP